MALFSFRHSTKTFSPKVEKESRKAILGQTPVHLRYITRAKAARTVLINRLGDGPLQQVALTAEADAQKRKGRVCERFIIALPKEASEQQKEALARAYCELLTKGTAGYVAAIHDQNGNDKKPTHAFGAV